MRIAGHVRCGEKCLSANDRQGARKLSDSYFKPSVQRHLSRWKEPDYKQALKQRQIWCEGTFAIQKRCHNLTRVLRRGLEAAEDHCLLSATALNLRRMILGHHLTPEGVFFLPMIYFPLLNGDFVNGPILGLLTKWEFSTAGGRETGKKKDALGVNSNTLSFS